MKNLYGLHLGGSQDGVLDLARHAVKQGADVIQVFASDPSLYQIPAIQPEFRMALDEVPAIIHSPYWVSFFNQKVRKLHMTFIRNLDTAFATKSRPLHYVTHVGTPDLGMSSDACYNLTVNFMDEVYSRVRPKNTTIVIENSALPISKYNINLSVLEKVKDRFPQMELCIDTEHAFASGEDLLSVNWNNYKLIHMNALPLYVKKGEALDRHSWTLLSKGKPLIYEMLEKLKGHSNKWIVVERRDPEMSFVDIADLKKRLEDDIIDRKEGSDS